MSTTNPEHPSLPRRLANRRTVLASIIAVASLGLLWLVQSYTELGQQLFVVGDVMGMNSQSNVTQERIAEVLRHLQLGLLGSAMVALMVLTGSWDESHAEEPSGRFDRLRRVVPIAILLCIVVVNAVPRTLAHSFVLNKTRHFYLIDDAMNSMRFARNFIQGLGLTYNPGEYVEGYTNFLWVLVMAAIHWLGAGIASAPLWVLVLSWACLALTALLTMDFAKACGATRTWALCAAVLVVCDENSVLWALSGLETSALMAGVVTCAWAMARQRPWVFTSALGVVVLVRADGFIVAAPLLFVAYLLPSWRVGFLRIVALPTVVFCSHLLFRRIYYGDWLPNTYYLRMIGAADRMRIGVSSYGMRLAISYPFVVLLGVSATFSNRLPVLVRWLTATALAYTAYAIWLGGDIFFGLRFVAPVLPVYFGVSVLLLQNVLDGVWAKRVAQVVVIASSATVMSYTAIDKALNDSKYVLRNLGLAKMLTNNVPPGTTSTIYPAGTLAYYTNHIRYVDVFGKNDRHLAHLDRYSGLALGHNKLDFDYIYDQRKVDLAFIIGQCSQLVNPRASSTPESTIKINTSLDLSHPTFVQRYLQNPVRFVGVATPAALECVFVRDDANIPLFWSSMGAPRRSTHVRLECDDADDNKPAGRGLGWTESLEDQKNSTCRLKAGGTGVVDWWIDITRPGRVELCLLPTITDMDGNINKVPIHLARQDSGRCKGTVLSVEIPAHAISTNTKVTRMELHAGLEDRVVDWMEWKSK